MDERRRTVRDMLGRHGLGSEISDLVELWTSPDPGGTEAERGNITVGYVAGGRRRETATVSLPNLDEALSLLRDRDRLAGLVSLGVGAMPAGMRPTLPHWIAESEEARRVRRDMARAAGLAEAAADGRDVRRDDPPTSPGAPF